MKSPRFFIGDRVHRHRRLRPRTVLRILRTDEAYWYRLLGPEGEESCWEKDLRRF